MRDEEKKGSSMIFIRREERKDRVGRLKRFKEKLTFLDLID